MQPVLKAPGSVLSQLIHYGPLSEFAFKFKLRRYGTAVINDSKNLFHLSYPAGSSTLDPKP
jgi:hypothetical protein